MNRFESKFFIVLILLISGTARATPPQPDDFVFGSCLSEFTPVRLPADAHPDYLSELLSVCEFLQNYQVTDQNDPDYGGMIEDEFRTGDDRIVQTDNTQEAIYVWSRYYQLTDDDQFSGNIAAAWEYCLKYPAWNEESGYYKVWNCGWGLRCSMQYFDSLGEPAPGDYAAQCAEYISIHAETLPFDANPPGVGVRNALTTSWAAWNLAAWARHESDTDYQAKAVQLAEKVRNWVESDPENITKVAWALSGGVAAACVLDVLFPDDPDAATAWRNEFLSSMPDYYNPDDFGAEAWVSAWDSWQALAQNALWRTTHDFQHRRTSLEQTDFLRACDTDHDGGIPANPSHPDTEDQTWVSTYIILMGIARIEEPPDLQLSMNKTAIHSGDACRTFLHCYNPGFSVDPDLYIALEYAGAFLFYPQFDSVPVPLHIPMNTDENLAEVFHLDDPILLLEIDPWPQTEPLEFTWWTGMVQHGTANLIGDIYSLPWHTE